VLRKITLRDWVHRFNVEGPDGLYDRKPPGRQRWLNDDEMRELSQIIETGPDLKTDGVIRWQRIDLARVIEERFGVVYAERSISRLLAELEFSHMSTRPQHPEQDSAVVDAFKKTSPARLPPTSPICRQQHPSSCGGRTKRASARRTISCGCGHARQPDRASPPISATNRPTCSVPSARRAARGAGAAVMMPTANTHAMQLHLEAISATVATGAHAAVLMNRAGWHTTGKLNVPDNITIILLPSKSPELNPVEDIWRYMRQNWLSARVFPSYEAILDAGCDAWNRLIAQPQTITSIGTRKWANIGQS
jgi:transposase